MFERKHRLLASALAAGAALSYAGVASAATMTINGDPGDYRVKQDSSGTVATVSVTSAKLPIGDNGGDVDLNAVYAFNLPQLNAGEQVGDANLFFYNGGRFAYANDKFSADLYGIAFGPQPVSGGAGIPTRPAEFNESQTDTNDPTNVKLEDDIITPATAPNHNFNTSSAGDVALANYIQGFYDSHPAYDGSSYVFLRVSQDSEVSPKSLLNLASADDSNASHRPVLTLNTVVPEPASLALLGLGGLVMLGRRRRA